MPSGAAGRVREARVSKRKVQGAAAGATAAAALLVLALGVNAFAIPRASEADQLRGENADLRAELDDVRGQLRELEPTVQRVLAYDEELRKLAARGALPGFGPLDEEAMREREAWIRGMVGEAARNEGEVDQEELFADLRAIDFGQLAANLEAVQGASQAMPQLWPVEGTVTSGYGWRRNPFGRTQWKFHTGIDIGAEYGSPILATGAGLVVLSDWDSGHGQTVEIDHGNGIGTRYCHASALLVSEGDEVLAGETVALVGSTGMSTGPHLHYELLLDGEKVDPQPYLPDGGP